MISRNRNPFPLVVDPSRDIRYHTIGLEKPKHNRSGGAMFRVLPWMA
jgi:hypothetical protein